MLGLLPAALVACDAEPGEPASLPGAVGEARALEDARSMLEETPREIPRARAAVDPADGNGAGVREQDEAAPAPAAAR